MSNNDKAIDRDLMEGVQLPYLSTYKIIAGDHLYFSEIEDIIIFSRYLPLKEASTFLLLQKERIETEIHSKMVFYDECDHESYFIENEDDYLNLPLLYTDWIKLEYESRHIQKEMDSKGIVYETRFHYWRFPDRDKLTTLVNTLTELEIILRSEKDIAETFLSGVRIEKKLKYNQSLPHFVYLFSCLESQNIIQDVQRHLSQKYCLNTLGYKRKTGKITEGTSLQYWKKYNHPMSPPNKEAEKQIKRILSILQNR